MCLAPGTVEWVPGAIFRVVIKLQVVVPHGRECFQVAAL
jgi:hypothetical protein